MFYEVSIQAASSGFGEYEVQPINGEGWADGGDLLAEIEGNVGGVVRLGDGAELPDGADDIRGRVHNEPAEIYVGVGDDGRVFYFGISEV